MRRFTWDDLQFFLAVARSGQLASAARQLRTNHATVSRRIDRLEQALSAKLFERNPRGYMLTAVGERLVQSAEQIEREAGNFRNEASSGASPVTGVVRLSSLEGFGNYFLADRLPRFAQAHANLSIEMVTIQQIVSLSKREADMSITLTSPRTDFYRYEKIATYRLFDRSQRQKLDDQLAATAPTMAAQLGVEGSQGGPRPGEPGFGTGAEPTTTQPADDDDHDGDQLGKAGDAGREPGFAEIALPAAAQEPCIGRAE